MASLYLSSLVRALRNSMLLGLAGCAVYVPTVPSTPLVRQGEVEVTAGLRTLTTLEAGAAFSPKNHVLFSGEAALQRSNSTHTVNNVTTENLDVHQQVGLGVGAYTITKTPNPMYLAAVAGVGYADADVYDYGLFRATVHYQAQYQRYYGQLYLAELSARGSFGFSVRGTWVEYQQLLQDGLPIQSINHFYLEPHAFGRVGTGPFQAYATMGISMPGTRGRDSNGAAAAALAPSTLLLGAGVVFRPHLLRQPPALPPSGQ